MLNKNQRQVKLFISSAFLGLFKEREVLAKQVFPEIRRRCRERQVDFVEIDLRWGILPEQVDSGEFVPICFARIDEGRPYFLGLLGERYGTAMRAQQVASACAQYPHYAWLQDYADRSITELEISQALFPVGQKVTEAERQATVERALFYFRDPAYAHRQSPPEEYLDSPENSQKQNELKQRIRDLGCQVTEYALPDDLQELVLRQLWSLIEQDYPENEQPTALEREQIEHDAFAHSRQVVYIRREADFARLMAHAQGDTNQPLVILGESGMGKTALLANWAMAYRQAQSQPDEFIFWHFCGSSPASTDPIAMLRRLMMTLQQVFKIEDEVPTTAEAVIEQLPLWLAKIQRRAIIIFDGLNQLQLNPNTIHWLPQIIPAPVRLFLSTLSPQGIEGEILTLAPLSESEQKQLIQQYLARLGRQLAEPQLAQLLAAPQTANPLYLQVILEELRLFGDAFKLGQRLTYYLEAETIPALYQKVLARLEADYQPAAYPNLVNQALSLLWATRQGLSESELLTLLNQPQTEPLPQAIWSPLYLALSSALVNRAGFLNFFHDYLRQAVEQRYLSETDYKKAIHRQLADFFATLPLNSRQADELPYQLEQAGEKTRLQACISEIPMFLQLMRDDKKYELLGYWARLDKLQLMADMYWKKSLSLNLKFFFYRLARFFYLIKRNPDMDSASDFIGYLLNFLRTARTSDKDIEPIYRMQALIQKWIRPKNANTANSLNELASLLHDKGDYDGAEPLYRRALAIREKVLGVQHPSTATSLNNLAALLYYKGDYDGAEPLYRRALAIREKVLGAQHPDTANSLNNLAELLRNKGDYDSAEPLYRRALAIKEKVLGAQHPNTATSLNNLALLLENKGDYDGAEPLYRRALAIREKVLGAQHPDTAKSLNNLAGLLEDKGDYNGAEPLYRRALAIHEKVLGAQHPLTAISLDNLASLLSNKGDYGGAKPLYRRALAIHEKVLGAQHPDTATSLNNLAELLRNKGDYDSAEPLYRRALAIREKVLGAQHPDTATSLNNLAALLYFKGDYDGAEPLYRRALAIREKVLGAQHPDTATSLNNLAGLLRNKGDYDGAEPLYRRALAIREKVLGAQHPDTAKSLNNLAALLEDKGDYDGAEPLYRRALAIREEVLGAQHP
jgi:tetratricopeptide (TPR) repeat protein